MTLISKSTVDLVKHYWKYCLCFYTDLKNCVCVGSGWDSRMTREGYDQCLGISHNLSPILPWCTQLTRYQLKIKVKWSNHEVSWTNVRKTNKTICIYSKTQQCGKPNCSHEFSIISTPTDCSWILYFENTVSVYTCKTTMKKDTISSWEQDFMEDHFCHNAPNRPDIHYHMLGATRTKD